MNKISISLVFYFFCSSAFAGVDAALNDKVVENLDQGTTQWLLLMLFITFIALPFVITMGFTLFAYILNKVTSDSPDELNHGSYTRGVGRASPLRTSDIPSQSNTAEESLKEAKKPKKVRPLEQVSEPLVMERRDLLNAKRKISIGVRRNN